MKDKVQEQAIPRAAEAAEYFIGQGIEAREADLVDTDFFGSEVGVISWSWWWIIAPLWIPYVLVWLFVGFCALWVWAGME